jgi:hypothetical protein
VGELKLNVPPLLLPGEMDCLALPELEVWLTFGVVGATENPLFEGATVFAFADGANVMVAFLPLARLSLVT